VLSPEEDVIRIEWFDEHVFDSLELHRNCALLRIRRGVRFART
jgi:hypothetical protein